MRTLSSRCRPARARSALGSLLLAVLLAVATAAGAREALTPDEVPAALAPWLDWALFEIPDHACAQFAEGDARHCVWYGGLALDFDDAGGSFSTSVQVSARSWVELPGGDGRWPQDVTDFGQRVPVVSRDGRPAVRLAAGRHELAGRFRWAALPEVLEVPPAQPLLSLSVNGTARAAALPPDGQLWLGRTDRASAEASERLDLEVFRLLDDAQPFTVETLLELDVAGNERELALTGAVLEGGIAMRLASPLPARLEADGRLRLIVRPGRWQIRIASRYPARVATLALPALPPPWPASEVWSFAANHALRVVEIEGTRPIDPRQTRLPPEWQPQPAWQLVPGEALAFRERRRGDPEPEPDRLSLHRELWLDFAGTGYTANDRLHGRITRGWRLEAAPETALGRVLLNGEAQFITTVSGGAAGVEVRRGDLDLLAESRYDGDRAALPAVGWAHGVEQLSATLHLPPGWRLWSVAGVDNLPDTWLNRWTLLDLFLVLVATVATARLYGRRAALLVLLTLVALWQEPGAPRQVWLHLLAAFALLGVLPAGGRLRTLVIAYRNLCLLALAVIGIPFTIDCVREGLYPQLARAHAQIGYERPVEPVAQAEVATDVAGLSAESRVAPEALQDAMRAGAAPSATPAPGAVVSGYDPKARIQTGPGLPDWRWQAIELGWSGPVEADQQVRLWLTSPAQSLVYALLQVGLLFALSLAVVSRAVGRWPLTMRGTAEGMALVLVTTLAVLPHDARATDVPDPELLGELTRRLTLPPACLPTCNALARASAVLAAERLLLRLEAHVADGRVALPLPGLSGQWLPESVLVDGAAATSLRRDAGGRLWLALPAGTHEVVLAGAVPAGSSFQVPFHLVPQAVTASAEGWGIGGLRPDGGSDGQLIFTRLAPGGAGEVAATLEPQPLPALFRVERTLRLGLDWRVETVVTRLTPADSAAELAIPLLPGEAVTTEHVRVEDGDVRLAYAASETMRRWDSVLERAARVRLTAPETSAWVETWRADISPLWHATLEGLAVVHHQDASGRWLPTWQPWPGEVVTLALTRPAGVGGPVLTVERSALELRPAERASAARLRFDLRSSQGGRHTLRLPADAVLERVAIDGVTQPIRADGSELSLPLEPGTRGIELEWRSAAGLATRYSVPSFSLGLASVNARVTMHLPEDRWVLLAGGPRVGPAVLFWGVLAVLAVIAVALGRSRLTPLSGWQWLLLFVGLTQAEIGSALLVVGWLCALSWCERHAAPTRAFTFDLRQCALVVLSLLGLAALFEAVRRGLLGWPDMQIAGNGSSPTRLEWYADRAGDDYPDAWVVSVSLWWYRGLMLTWSLWLAVALLGWLRHAWRVLARDGLWRPLRRASSTHDAPPVAEEAAPAGTA